MEISNRLMPAKLAYLAETVFWQEYQSTISFLIYTILNIRPNLVFIILIISQFSSNPIIIYITIIKQIFKYLKEILYIKFIFYKFL
jgi:hypothetical protein